ncbi:MAG: hypothetical protein J7L90_03935 [Dehalococcoidia bacterium]|nr:hypothetical protein [Dehalococcoidia bacterium]
MSAQKEVIDIIAKQFKADAGQINRDIKFIDDLKAFVDIMHFGRNRRLSRQRWVGDIF